MSPFLLLSRRQRDSVKINRNRLSPAAFRRLPLFVNPSCERYRTRAGGSRNKIGCYGELRDNASNMTSRFELKARHKRRNSILQSRHEAARVPIFAIVFARALHDDNSQRQNPWQPEPFPWNRPGASAMINLRQASAMLVAIAVVAAASPTPAAPPEPAVSEATIVPLFPQKERDLKKGVPPGMTVASFWAGHGTAKLTKLPDGKILTEFDFEGLIPYGVYTLWNVVETEPFKDEPYTEFGAGKHAIVADGSGRAHKVVQRDSWPGKEFLLDYHADGKLSQAAGVYPGALWGKFPASPER